MLWILLPYMAVGLSAAGLLALGFAAGYQLGRARVRNYFVTRGGLDHREWHLIPAGRTKVGSLADTAEFSKDDTVELLRQARPSGVS